MKHNTSSEFAGKKVVLKDAATHPQFAKFGGQEFVVEDWWDRVAGKSWMISDGNPACLIYTIRSAHNSLPLDDEVVYGKLGMMGCLVHVSEIA
jgi:hypothetical protein